jgi:N-succinyldiaminopimelate aminotransferase
MPGSVYSPSAGRHDAVDAQACPLNVGDTWLQPFAGARMEDLHAADHPTMNRYSPTQGIPPLLDAIVDKVRARNGQRIERDGVLVCAGATAALGCAVGMLVAADEEVLILAPFWPLIRGIVQTFRAKPVEVPFYDRVNSAEDAVEAVRERITERSVALYVSTPSNPTGRALPESWLAALAELARTNDLWLLSDEVYEDYTYGVEHVSMGAFAPERTLSVYSFSKAYGMAGNRVGYLTGPPEAVANAGKVGTHTFYCAPTASQLAATVALRDGQAWIDEARTHYRATGESAAEKLSMAPPEGSTFLFLDATPVLDDRGLAGFLEDCLSDGVALAPGHSCGSAYADWARLCYTAAPPDEVGDAIDQVAKRLQR